MHHRLAGKVPRLETVHTANDLTLLVRGMDAPSLLSQLRRGVTGHGVSEKVLHVVGAVGPHQDSDHHLVKQAAWLQLCRCHTDRGIKRRKTGWTRDEWMVFLSLVSLFDLDRGDRQLHVQPSSPQETSPSRGWMG